MGSEDVELRELAENWANILWGLPYIADTEAGLRRLLTPLLAGKREAEKRVTELEKLVEAQAETIRQDSIRHENALRALEKK